MDAILELRDLVKHYPAQRAVDGINLTIPRGGFYSLVGPSGCGKTTTLRLIAGFEQPTAGEVRLGGAVVNHQRPYERNVSTVFQSYALFPHLTARENIEFGLKRKRTDGIARPLAALDPKLRKQMRLELKEMQRRVGITFLLVTHDQEEALSMSDQLAVMNAGRIEQVGSPEDVYLRPRTRFVAGFLGAVNWIGE